MLVTVTEEFVFVEAAKPHLTGSSAHVHVARAASINKAIKLRRSARNLAGRKKDPVGTLPGSPVILVALWPADDANVAFGTQPV